MTGTQSRDVDPPDDGANLSVLLELLAQADRAGEGATGRSEDGARSARSGAAAGDDGAGRSGAVARRKVREHVQGSIDARLTLLALAYEVRADVADDGRLASGLESFARGAARRIDVNLLATAADNPERLPTGFPNETLSESAVAAVEAERAASDAG